MRKRLITIALVFVAAVLITTVASVVPVEKQEATKTTDQLRNTIQTLKDNDMLLQYIFGNNFMITLLMFVPFAGPLIGGYVLFNTGLVVGSIAVSQDTSPLLSMAELFLTPIAWLEYIVYAMAMAASIWLSWRILQNRSRHEMVNTAKFMSLSAVILFVAAVIETAIIYAAV